MQSIRKNNVRRSNGSTIRLLGIINNPSSKSTKKLCSVSIFSSFLLYASTSWISSTYPRLTACIPDPIVLSVEQHFTKELFILVAFYFSLFIHSLLHLSLHIRMRRWIVHSTQTCVHYFLRMVSHVSRSNSSR